MQDLTKNKWIAVRSFINYWLKDKTYYCNVCGMPFDPRDKENGHWKPCCEEPQIGRNIDHCMGVVKQNKELQKVRINDVGSTKDKSFRWGISMPPRLMKDLEDHFRSKYKEKLFNDQKELRQFMKEFPAFMVAKKI